MSRRRYERQKYRVYIHGHSFRHAFGTPHAKEVTDWLVKLYSGEVPGFHGTVFDYSVHKLTDEGYWAPISRESQRQLQNAVHGRLAKLGKLPKYRFDVTGSGSESHRCRCTPASRRYSHSHKE